MTPQDILHQARQAGVLLVRFLYCGNDGIVRGKATHIDHLGRRLSEGIGLPMGLQCMTTFDRLVPGGHYGPIGEVRLLPDPATFAILPYTPRQARLWCNLMQLDRRPWGLCPRDFLQRMLVSVRHTAGLCAADQQLAVRETIRGVARQHGLVASFAPKPLIDRAGSGCHMHLSLWDTQAEQNLLYDANDPLRLSAMGYAFITGVLTHLPALVALTAPSVNSYRRLQPHVWSAVYACYGLDNREAAVRLASPFWEREMASLNLEFRPCDATCNPYLALGGLLAAGLDGLLQQRHPGPAVSHNPALLDDEARRQGGICRLPQSLDDALAALQADTALTAALGCDLAQEYTLVKHAEAAAFRAHDLAFELAQHLEVY